MASVDRGSLTVRNITNELVDIADWESVGVELGVSATKLSEIRANRMNNGPLCKISMADTWLRSDVNASWEKLADALDRTKNTPQAEHIRNNDLYYADFGGGASAPAHYSTRTSSANSAQTKKRRVEADNSAVRRKQAAAPTRVERTDDVRKLFQASEPEKGEGSRVEEIVHTIINNEVDINERDDKGSSLLQEAIQKCDFSSVKALIALGANVNQRNGYNLTALDVVDFMLGSNPSHPKMSQIIKDVGGVSGRDGPPQQQPAGDQQMDTGEEQTSKGAGNFMLCLDNSSTMALVQLELLHRIEKATGKKITELFQWIVASGIGGLLMLVMVYGKKSIAELRHFYFKLYDRVFANPQVDRGQELQAIISEELGDPSTPGDCVYMHNVTEPRLLIGAVNKRMSTLDLKFFTNYAGGEGGNVHVWKVARYTCSSPLYFGEYDNYIDTSVVCKNLCGIGLEKINSYYKSIQPDTYTPDPISMVVSLGDGILPAQQLGIADSAASYYLSSPSRLNNPKELLRVFQNVVALYSSAASYQSEAISAALCQRWCDSRNISFIRFNPLFKESIPIPEEASIETLINVIIQTISHIATGVGKEKIKELLKDV